MAGDIGFQKAIDKFETEIIEGMKRVVAETAEMAASQMKALAPVGKIAGGNLRKSIDVFYGHDGLSARIIVGAHYGIYVEHGTGIHAENGDGKKEPWVYFSEELGWFVVTEGMKARPFFYPAMEQAADYFTREMNRLG